MKAEMTASTVSGTSTPDHNTPFPWLPLDSTLPG
jgi:hypothetical protein